jgi:hypothetical protein
VGQAKLHRWAAADPGRRFDDLFNLVHDPATLIVAFARVAGNKGANTPGVDGMTAASVGESVGVPGFLDDLRAALKDGSLKAKIRALTRRTSQLDPGYVLTRLQCSGLLGRVSGMIKRSEPA